MARINIEDSLFKDPRFFDLVAKVGCKFKAMGLVTFAWILAQEHWIKHRSIPAKAWPKALDALIEVELAGRREDGSVYVKGSKAAFAWLDQRSNAGKSQSPEKLAALQKARDARVKNSKNTERTLNGDERKLNGSEPLTLSLTLEDTTLGVPKVGSEFNKHAAPSGQRLVSRYCELYAKHYGGDRPPLQGKDTGMLKRLGKDLGTEKALALLDAYFAMPDPWVHKTAHAVNVFASRLNEVQRFQSSGSVVTMTDVRDKDREVSVRMADQRFWQELPEDKRKEFMQGFDQPPPLLEKKT